MKIAASALQLSAAHSETTRHEIRERLRMWSGPASGGSEEGAPVHRSARPPTASIMISDAARSRQTTEADAIDATADAAAGDPLLSLLRALIEAITGQRMKIFDGRELTPKAPSPDMPDPAHANNEEGGKAARSSARYERHESYSERESTRFAADGVVRTADDREIRFSIELAMARSYHAESDLSLSFGNARKEDPLVINFAGNAAHLSDRRFSIDLDADGRAEVAHFVGPGSGFLVFDRNGDGRINDGREMFGASTGDGFAELAAFDGDGNGWIDEADAGYAALRVWTKAADGSNRLATLAEADVGAIALANIATPFAIKDSANVGRGEIRSSSVYLRESGAAGTIQQVDLSV